MPRSMRSNGRGPGDVLALPVHSAIARAAVLDMLEKQRS